MNALQYVTHNSADLHINGTCLQGEIRATYKELVAMFGEPMEGDGYKVDAEWVMRFGDGTIATVYNWKDGINYCGAKDGTPTKEITEWHVGGASHKAVENVQITLDLHREREPKNPAEQMIESHYSIMESVAMKHGKGFAGAVHVGYLVAKQIELFGTVIRSAQAAEGPMPEHLADALGGAMSGICAKLLDAYCQSATVCESSEESKKLMAWVDRLIDTEQSGLDALLKDFHAKRGA